MSGADKRGWSIAIWSAIGAGVGVIIGEMFMSSLGDIAISIFAAVGAAAGTVAGFAYRGNGGS